MALPTPELAGEHYQASDTQLRGMGEKTLKIAAENGETLAEIDPIKIGMKIRQWNMDYLSCGPVLVLVMLGPHIIEVVRKMVGVTNPLMADVGTIRADYSPDSISLANWQERTTRTIIHASDSVEGAEREIGLWFKKDEIFEYETAIEKVLFDTSWSLKS